MEADPNYPWRFDLELAERPIRYIETFLKPTKGDYDKMTLLPWECFFEANLYGWVSKEDGRRRYREGLLVVGRGNGKSTLIAGNATFGASKDGEYGADVYLLANSKEQAGVTYETACSMINASPMLTGHFKALKSEIRYAKTNSSIRRLSSDARKLDGLNPHLAIFDEIHEYQTYKLINVIRRGMNKRRQPLCIYITTMGTVLDGPLMRYYQLVDNILTGIAPVRVADRIFALIYELDSDDDIEDTDVWIKANPSLGTLLELETLKDDWARAKLIPEERSDFVTKQLDIFANASEAAFLDWDVLRRNNTTYPESGLIGRECCGGFDLSNTEDFTSACLTFPLDDGRFYCLSHSWVPERKVKLDQEKIPYYEWAMQGYLTICPGEYIEKEAVYEWFKEQRKKYEIRSIGYDPAQATMLVKMLESSRFKCNVVRQGPLTLSPIMQEVKEMLISGRLVTNNNPMMFWYLKNVRLRRDPSDRQKGNLMPTKADKYKKIDGFAAFLDSMAEYVKTVSIESEVEPAVEVYSLWEG